MFWSPAERGYWVGWRCCVSQERAPDADDEPLMLTLRRRATNVERYLTSSSAGASGVGVNRGSHGRCSSLALATRCSFPVPSAFLLDPRSRSLEPERIRFFDCAALGGYRGLSAPPARRPAPRAARDRSDGTSSTHATSRGTRGSAFDAASHPQNTWVGRCGSSRRWARAGAGRAARIRPSLASGSSHRFVTAPAQTGEAKLDSAIASRVKATATRSPQRHRRLTSSSAGTGRSARTGTSTASTSSLSDWASSPSRRRCLASFR